MNGLEIAVVAIFCGYIARILGKLHIIEHERDQWRQTALNINQQLNERKQDHERSNTKQR